MAHILKMSNDTFITPFDRVFGLDLVKNSVSLKKTVDFII